MILREAKAVLLARCYGEPVAGRRARRVSRAMAWWSALLNAVVLYRGYGGEVTGSNARFALPVGATTA